MPNVRWSLCSGHPSQNTVHPLVNVTADRPGFVRMFSVLGKAERGLVKGEQLPEDLLDADIALTPPLQQPGPTFTHRAARNGGMRSVLLDVV